MFYLEHLFPVQTRQILSHFIVQEVDYDPVQLLCNQLINSTKGLFFRGVPVPGQADHIKHPC